ncbi:MAG: hypothetical protein QOF76_970 [Solirubrobacteraceae bacterium]|jgi:hypothetical protein|nr:hypothetical protein [Solirubrobacteraceae bacterium]
MSAARSVSGVIVAAVLLGGCTTTQDVNGRYELRAKRILAGREPVRVTMPNPAVAVDRVQVVRGHGTAVVVELTNRTDDPLTDLPITVGIGDKILNDHKGQDYFQGRVAAIAPHGHTRWVFVTHRPVPPKGAPFARVGSQAAPHAASVGALPALATTASAPASGQVRVKVSNPTEIPQYNFPVYALAAVGGRYVAAGRATVEELDKGSASTVAIRLQGAAPHAPVELEALPSIFK